MIIINDKRECSGCSACYAICGRNAIEMKDDSLGFKYPDVDPEKCVECGLCEKVCAFNDDYSTPDNYEQPLAIGGRHNNIKEVDKSRSGGIFAALSDVILSDGGVIYGAGYDSSFRVMHKRATSAAERDELRGSKYVQSDMGDVFRQVESDLKANRNVLFSGTPCQTAGLSSFLKLRKVNCDRLLICDI
ncbi:MAG: 4Fe-4S dicluster domain-containing protein, partial [Muribaculaceae bacterium]|nr:4Fe-4S dicluster domain-containing protein [Muribaculaceae bacterium]